MGDDGVDKVRENRLRRQAKRLGLWLKKSRARQIHLDNHGEYMLLDLESNFIVAGSRFDLELDDVQAWLDEYEGKIVAAEA
jgi:hypothetical protein